MRRYILVTCFLMAGTAFPQIIYINKFKRKELDKVPGKSVYVLLLDADSLYNKRIKNLVTEHYRLTPYTFIKQSELEKLNNDPHAVIMTISKYTFHYSSYNVDKGRSRTVSLNGLVFGLFLFNYSQGAFSNETPLSSMNELLFATEFPNISDEKTASGTIGCVAPSYGEAYTQMGFMVFNNYLQKYFGGMNTKEKVSSHIRKNLQRLDKKTLLVGEPDLCIVRDSVPRLYPFPHKLVEMDELCRAIASKDSNQVVYWPNYSGFSSTELIVCPGTWDIYYAYGKADIETDYAGGRIGFKFYKDVIYTNGRRSNEKWADPKFIGTGFSPLTCRYIGHLTKKGKKKKR